MKEVMDTEARTRELRDVVERVRKREDPASTIGTGHMADLLGKAVESSDDEWRRSIDDFAAGRGITPTRGGMTTEYMVEDSAGAFGPAIVSADTPFDAACVALDAWGYDCEITHDGEEQEMCVRPVDGGKPSYFRGVASVNITWTAAEIKGPEIDGPKDDDEG